MNPSDAERYVSEKLFALQDADYRIFQAKLLPTIAPENIIGIRIPLLRKLAAEISKSADIAAPFISILPHKYYDEYNLHGMLIERIGDYERTIYELDRFLPFVDNWATCDTVRPRVFRKHLPELRIKIDEWIASGAEYTIRYGLEMLMCFYLDDLFSPDILECAASVHADEYYVRMMVAWLFATALAKQYDAAVHYIEQRRLDKWTHNKAIQKAIESYRVTEEHKSYLKTLCIK